MLSHVRQLCLPWTTLSIHFLPLLSQSSPIVARTWRQNAQKFSKSCGERKKIPRPQMPFYSSSARRTLAFRGRCDRSEHGSKDESLGREHLASSGVSDSELVVFIIEATISVPPLRALRSSGSCTGRAVGVLVVLLRLSDRVADFECVSSAATRLAGAVVAGGAIAAGAIICCGRVV